MEHLPPPPFIWITNPPSAFAASSGARTECCFQFLKREKKRKTYILIWSVILVSILNYVQIHPYFKSLEWRIVARHSCLLICPCITERVPFSEVSFLIGNTSKICKHLVKVIILAHLKCTVISNILFSLCLSFKGPKHDF